MGVIGRTILSLRVRKLHHKGKKGLVNVSGETLQSEARYIAPQVSCLVRFFKK
jgi:hypothetical protein